MPTILVLDTSTDACSVALAQQNEISSLFELAAKSHTRRLLPMVDELLQQADCRMNQVDAIAYGCGPGSFTGLRICLGVVQGLAFGTDVPVIPISTLTAMAQGFYTEQPNTQDQPLLVALDARMQEVYWSLFEYRNGVAIPLLEEAVMSPADVAAHPEVQARAGKFYGCGPGWHYPELASLANGVVEQNYFPNAKHIATLAIPAYERGEWVEAAKAEPVYLRDQVSWQKRQRIRTSDQPG